MATCNLCPEEPADDEILDHLRVMHPEAWGDGPETWPDGENVIVDKTLMPGDFEEQV